MYIVYALQYVCIVEWLIQLINTSIPWWGGCAEYRNSTLRNVWKWTSVDERGLRSLNKMPCVWAQIKKLKADKHKNIWGTARETSQGLRACAVPGPQIWFLASTCWLTAVCSSSYRDLMCSSVSMGPRYSYGAAQNTHIHEIKRIKSLKVGYIECRFYVKCSWNIILFLFVML